MSDVPECVLASPLWRKLQELPDLQAALLDIRRIAGLVAAQTERVMPGYTDHSVTHMDGLWSIASQVFSPPELAHFTPGEAFVLGCSFYVHDLGMALRATAEGLHDLMETDAFRAAHARFRQAGGVTEEVARQKAIEVAARELHGAKARELVENPIPGVDVYLMEKTEIREKWAGFVGDVSASHTWSLPTLENKLGVRGYVPDPIGGQVDLGFLGCALRVIDYAHMNLNRTPFLARVLRSKMDPASVLHWRAQEYITGPLRQDNRLVFGCTRPIADPDAWWLLFSMASGLDSEITSVAEYLSNRTISAGRFSLEGVKGTRSPQNFALCVLPEGFEPADVRFHPDSIDRLVEILGGRSLYGKDHFAPLRELIQNARDAILLQRAADTCAGAARQPEEVKVSVENDSAGSSLIVEDTGVGMTTEVITNYLLGIASDYWNSPHFFANFPGAAEVGFRPAGRFGIGFLSIFMIGDRVEVQTQRRGHPHATLTLYGIGRHGVLIVRPPKASSGTRVKVQITKQDPADYISLEAVVRARAPMLDFPVRVVQQARGSVIAPGWWKNVSQEELDDFVGEWEISGLMAPSAIKEVSETEQRWLPYARVEERLMEADRFAKWPGRQPEVIDENHRIMAIPRRGKVLLCSRGIAVGAIYMNGLTGILQVDDLELNTARTRPVEWNVSEFRNRIIRELQPALLQSLRELSREGTIPSRFEFLAKVGNAYGTDLLLLTDLPWITVIEPPGNAVLVSPKEFLERIGQVADVLIGYAVNPWRAHATCRGHFPAARDDSPLIAVPSDGQPGFGSYRDEQKLTRGPLPEHFRKDYRGDAGHENAFLLLAILTLVAKAWQCDVDRLIQSDWCREETKSLTVHFRR